MLANRLLWRFSADKSSGAAKKESLWGSITVFRPEAGRVTGKDLQKLFCTTLGTHPKVRSTQNPAAAQQAHTALKSQHSIVSHHTRILVNPSTTAPGTREPAVHGDAFFCKSPAYAATSLGAPRDRDGDRDGDLSALRRRAADARPRGELPSSNQPSSPQGTLMARALCKKTTGMRLVMS